MKTSASGQHGDQPQALWGVPELSAVSGAALEALLSATQAFPPLVRDFDTSM